MDDALCLDICPCDRRLGNDLPRRDVIAGDLINRYLEIELLERRLCDLDRLAYDIGHGDILAAPEAAEGEEGPCKAADEKERHADPDVFLRHVADVVQDLAFFGYFFRLPFHLVNRARHRCKVMRSRLVDGRGKALRDFQLGNKIPHRIIAFIRVFLQRCQKALFEHGRDRRIVLRRTRHIPLHMLERDGDSSLPFEGQMMCQHFIEHDTKRVNIRLFRDLISGRLLRREVVYRA